MKNPYVKIPELPFQFGRVDLGNGLILLDQIIRHRGTPIKVTPHAICPCVNPSRSDETDKYDRNSYRFTAGTGLPSVDCGSCHGTGLTYIDEEAFDTVCVVSGVDARDTHTAEGTLSTGSIRLTFLSKDTVAEGDKIQLTQTIVPVRHIRRYHKSCGGIRLPFDVKSVKNLLILDKRKNKHILLKEHQDYTLGESKNLLEFPANSAVRDGAVVSGIFMVSPYYVVDQMTSAFRGQFTTKFSANKDWVKMPQAATAVRADIFFGRFDKDISHFDGEAEKNAGV